MEWHVAAPARHFKASVIDPDKPLACAFKITSVTDFSHADCPHCKGTWTLEGGCWWCCRHF